MFLNLSAVASPLSSLGNFPPSLNFFPFIENFGYLTLIQDPNNPPNVKTFLLLQTYYCCRHIKQWILHQRSHLATPPKSSALQVLSPKKIIPKYVSQLPETRSGLLPLPLDPRHLPPRCQRLQDPPVQQRRSSFWPPLQGLNELKLESKKTLFQVVTLGEGLPKYTDTAALALIIGHEVMRKNIAKIWGKCFWMESYWTSKGSA